MPFYAGFSRETTTPPMGIGLCGYYIDRKADTVLDDLEVNTVAFSDGKKTAVMMVLDAEGIAKSDTDTLRRHVAECTGLPIESVWLSCTHCHTGPFIEENHPSAIERGYFGTLKEKLVTAAKKAVADLKPARLGYAVATAPDISYVRRFRMKDGTIRTNPGVNNPDIEAPIGEVDERVNVVRIDRENAETIVIVNFGVHPDTVGGNNISADYPGFLRRTTERTLDNVKCVFLNGAEGDVNHVNVSPKNGEANGLFADFDGPRGYAHTRHMGNVLTGSVLQVYEKVNYVDTDKVDFTVKTVKVPANLPKPEEIPQATYYNDLHNAGRDDEIPFTAMALTTVVANAARIKRLEHGPEFFDIYVTVFAIGNIAFVGFSGEPFTVMGTRLKNSEAFKMILPCALTNGRQGYFPARSAYDEGGYEASASDFKAGVAELLVDEAEKVLNSAIKE